MESNVTRYERPSLTADCVAFTVSPRPGKGAETGELGLYVRLVKRSRSPEEGKWSLPGKFVSIDERIEDAMRDAATKKAGLDHPFYAEQLETFDTPGRDERWRVVSVAYLGIYPADAEVRDVEEDTRWFLVDQMGHTLCDPLSATHLRFDELAFDHAQILSAAIARLTSKSSYSDIALRFLGGTFVISEIKAVMEAVTGRTFNNVKRAFGSVIEEAPSESDPGEKKPAHRPAARYRRKGIGKETMYKKTNQRRERTE